MTSGTRVLSSREVEALAGSIQTATEKEATSVFTQMSGLIFLLGQKRDYRIFPLLAFSRPNLFIGI